MKRFFQILEESVFKNVSTYIQSGNIFLDTNLSIRETSDKIHDVIFDNIGADLDVIIKTKSEFEISIRENPFDRDYDYSRIHLVFTNDNIKKDRLDEVLKINFFEEKFFVGSECMYMYLPKSAGEKKLNNNFLEKKLGIVCTTRKLNVIKKLCEIEENNEKMRKELL